MKTKCKVTLLILSIVIIGLIVFNKCSNDKKVYILKEHNPDGKLIGANEYIIRNGDTVLHGKFVRYNEKGIKIAEGQFADNEPTGICSYYFDNGKIRTVYYRKDSKINLESTYYDQNGLINKYIMCDSLGKTAFIIKFEEKTVKMYDGYSIWPVGQYKIENKKNVEIKKDEVLKVGDTIRYYYLVANIPHTKRSFKIQNVGVDSSKVKRVIKTKLPTELIVEEVLTKKGLNRIEIIAKYTFDDKVTPVLNKKVSFDVNVN